MDIGMIVHAYYLKDARVRRYAELLVAEGHNVDVLCLREGDEPKKASHAGVNIHRIGIGRLRSGRLSYLLEYLSSFVLFFLKLNLLRISGRRYDILHVHNMPDILVFCALFQKWSGAKLILDVHDLMSEVYQSKYALPGGHWLPRALRLEERLSARFASAVITANHAFAEILGQRSVPASKVTVIMNAPNSQFFLSDKTKRNLHSVRDSEDFRVLYVGTMAPRYGVEVAVAAIAKLHCENAIPGLRFSIIPKIANEGTYLGDIISEVDKSGLRDRFELMGPVSHERMPEVLASVDAVIYTPIPDVHMDMALSLKIPEAIAVGCPIVASRLSVNTRYFGEDALFMFKPGDVDECAAGILDVYKNPDEAVKRAQRAKERLGEIAWEKQARSYMELVRQLCDDTGDVVGSC